MDVKRFQAVADRVQDVSREHPSASVCMFAWEGAELAAHRASRAWVSAFFQAPWIPAVTATVRRSRSEGNERIAPND